VPHCPICGKEIQKQSIDQVIDKVLKLPEGTRFQVLAPIAKGKKGEFQKEFQNAQK
jgi:excinuclease ABC subunit A